MRPTFHPYLVNGPLGDPALLVRLLGMSRNLFFDLGDVHPLPARPVLKATLAFISHAHVDHFCGFDTVVRYGLGRDRTFRLVGPPGMADRVEGKLNGYTWNLVASYEQSLVIEVLEWGDSEGRLWRFSCRDGFTRRDHGPVGLAPREEGVREVHRELAFRAYAAVMNHQVPSLAFALEEPAHVNISRDALRRLDLSPGPWVRRLKEAVLLVEPQDTPIALPSGIVTRLGDLLAEGVILVTEGQKLAYFADCLWDERLVKRAVALAKGAHTLYCEAAFLSEDAERARERYHMTAAQAGELARMAGAGELHIFHFSPKYRGREEELRAEAAEAFGGAVEIG